MNNFRHNIEKKNEILGHNGRTVETLPSETHRQVMRDRPPHRGLLALHS